ncbi:MAG: hypothetical protein KDC46_06190 [Thermoleophilia bacterium]|nr:hypothetical protein [Thermoleophilia bacterium]
MDAPAHDRDRCVAAIFQASDVTDFVDPHAAFPRSGLIAERLERTRRADAHVPCDSCGIAGCSTRALLGQRP